MRTVTITEREYDDEGRLVKETVTVDSEPVTYVPQVEPPKVNPWRLPNTTPNPYVYPVTPTWTTYRSHS